MSDSTRASRARLRLTRPWRHIALTLVAVVLVASMLGESTSRQDSRATIDDTIAISASSAAQAAQCHQGTNLAHVQAGRATRFLLWAWAKGSNAYLGWIWTATSLREGPTGTWTMVESCNGEEPPPAAGWPTVGYDLGSTRAAVSETAITTANVNTLGRAWKVDGLEGVSGTPIVSNGTIYVGTWAGQIKAFNANTGQQVWSADVGSPIPGAVAVSDTHVFAGTWDGRIVARNRQTGAAAWEKEVDTHEVTVVYGSPVYVDGKVIVPVSSDEWWDGENFTFRGSIVAYDPANGNELWRYWTSCGPENAGKNNCPASGANEGAGVASWSYPAVDLQRNTLYFGTGNHYYPPTTGRSDALIALDLDTGQQKWVRQFTPNDFWNLPGGAPSGQPIGPDADVMVASFFKVGNTDAVGVGDKAGNYKALNRDTGEVLWQVKISGGGIQGGVMASAAVAPAAKVGRTSDVLYVTSNRNSQNADLVAIDAANGAVLARFDMGAQVVSPPTWANGLVYITDNTGRIAAYSGVTQIQRAWEWKFPFSAASGISVVNGLVYSGWGWALNGESPQGGLVAFKLNGEPPDDEEPPADGEAIYQANCAACHGADASGGNGPDLRGIGERHTMEEIIQVITNGRGNMPAWREELTAEEIEAVATYIASIPGDGTGHEHEEH